MKTIDIQQILVRKQNSDLAVEYFTSILGYHISLIPTLFGSPGPNQIWMGNTLGDLVLLDKKIRVHLFEQTGSAELFVDSPEDILETSKKWAFRKRFSLRAHKDEEGIRLFFFGLFFNPIVLRDKSLDRVCR